MKNKEKPVGIMVILSVLIWFSGYGMIVLGSELGYIVEIAGAILTYIYLLRLGWLFKGRSNRVINILLVVLSLYFLFDVLINSFFFVKSILK